MKEQASLHLKITDNPIASKALDGSISIRATSQGLVLTDVNGHDEPLGISKDNTYLSDRAFIDGFNNVGGGYAARVIGYTASTKTIRLIALSDYHYEGEEGWKASLYQVGAPIYISTGNSDYKDFQKKTIVSVTPNTTSFTSGGTTTVTLNYIDIELDSEVSVFSDNETVSESSSFDPTNIFYQFQANALSDITGRPMCKLTLTASSLKCIPGTQVGIYSEGTSITRFSQSWSGDTLTITFTDSYASTPMKQFYLVSKVNGLEATTHVAIVKDDSFQYTVHISGEHTLATGLNSAIYGNGHVVAGDFSHTTGMSNTNLSINGNVGGTENDVGEGFDNYVAGCSCVISGRSNLVFGTRCVTTTDNNLMVGGLIKSLTMDNVGIGFNINFYPSKMPSGYNTGVGDQLTFASSNSFMVGRDLTIRADHAVLVGQHGELPQYTGNLQPVTELYATGDLEGIHYKGAFGLATGNGPGSSEDKKRISVIFSRYKWKKNPAYPYGTGDSLTVCPDVVGAGEGITAATLRSKTTEDPIILEDYPLLTINSNVIVNGSILSSARIKTYNDVAGTVTPVVIDPLESTVVKIVMSAGGTIMIMNGNNTTWLEGVTVRIYVKNGGAGLLFDNTSMKPIGEIPALTSNGYDVFEMVRLDDLYFYRHLGQYSAQ